MVSLEQALARQEKLAADTERQRNLTTRAKNFYEFHTSLSEPSIPQLVSHILFSLFILDTHTHTKKPQLCKKKQSHKSGKLCIFDNHNVNNESMLACRNSAKCSLAH